MSTLPPPGSPRYHRYSLLQPAPPPLAGGLLGLAPSALATLDARDPGATLTAQAFAELRAAEPCAATLVAPGPAPAAPAPAVAAADLTLASRARLGAWLATLPTLRIEDERHSAGDGAAPGKPDLTRHGVLGRGGMGVVLHATQRALARGVAVKVLPPEQGGDDRARALVREALILGRLEHPNIVPVYALGQEAPSRPAMVMKRIEGVSWSELVHDPEHPAWRELDADDRLTFHVNVLTQICRALEFAHGRGILHRDVKPGNVMIGGYGEVYLLDWGVALHLDERDQAEPALLGTPAYMAPEMVRGAAAGLDPRTDVYLLGATLHELLTGRPRHHADGLLATLVAAERSDPPELPADAPVELAELVRRATAADPDRRPPDVAAFRAELRAFLSHRSARALSDQAQACARDLERALAEPGEPDPARVERIHAHFAAAAFGFQVSLRAWPENQAAIAGLDAAARGLAWFELRRGDLDHAERLVAQHPGAAEPALVDELARRRQEAARRSEELLELRRLRDDLDLRRNDRARGRFFALLGLPIVGVSAILLWYAPDDRALTWPQVLGAVFFIDAAYLVVLWRYRAVLLVTLIDRRLSGGLLLLLAAMTAHRLLAWYDDLAISRTLTDDLFIASAMTLMVGVLLDRRMIGLCIPFVLGYILARLLPDRTGLAFTLAGVAGGLLIIPLLRNASATASADGAPVPPR